MDVVSYACVCINTGAIYASIEIKIKSLNRTNAVSQMLRICRAFKPNIWITISVHLASASMVWLVFVAHVSEVIVLLPVDIHEWT